MTQQMYTCNIQQK